VVLQGGRMRERGTPQQLSDEGGWFSHWKNIKPI
jgi:ABC-type multidrug transport system fused ATPase/permease subunit